MNLERKNVILLVCCSSIFFEALDIAIVNLAMPLIQDDFKLSTDVIQWIQVLYVLCYGGFLIVGGKLADIAGRKKIFMIGSFIFLLTSLGAGLSTEYYFLLINRAIQGIGAALVLPAAFSIITNTFQDEPERSKAISIFGSFAAIGSGSGLSLGGIMATYLGWQWIFFINVPVILASLVVAYIYIKPDHNSEVKKNVDILSGVLMTASILLLTYIVHELKYLHDRGILLASLALLSVSLSVLFFTRNAKQAEPLIDFTLLNRRAAITGYGAILLMGAFFTGYLFLISIVLQDSMNFSAAHAGFILFPFSVLSALTSKYILPNLLKKINIQQMGILGMALMFTGGVLLAFSIAVNHHLFMLLFSIACVTGTGIAVCFMAYNVVVLQAIPSQHHGLASSICNASFFFGGGLGLSIISLSMGDSYYVLSPVIILSIYALLGLLWLGVRFFSVKSSVNG